MKRTFLIGEDLAQAVLNYLQSKPFAEVASLITNLVKLEEAKPDTKADVNVQS